MRFLIIIPAHNEEENILLCLQSLVLQTYQAFEMVVVNDGSTDATTSLLSDFISTLKEEKKAQFSILDLEKSEHQPGAKVVRTFNKGLAKSDVEKFDVICKFDADIIFPENYLEKINQVYENQPNVGMVSGLVNIEKNGEWVYENLSSKNHVRGPIKSYRTECFEKMNGLRPVLGWDNLDVLLAKMHGFEVVTIKDLYVKHLRPTAYKYKNQKAEKLGEYFYNIGLNFPLTVISSLKSAVKNKSVSEFFITLKSFLKQNHNRVLSKEEIRFIRSYRWNEMFKKLKP